MSFLMLKDRVNFLYKYLTSALEEGLVSMKYPDNPKHPKQKYMLTEKGRKILENRMNSSNLCVLYFFLDVLSPFDISI